MQTLCQIQIGSCDVILILVSIELAACVLNVLIWTVESFGCMCMHLAVVVSHSQASNTA